HGGDDLTLDAAPHDRKALGYPLAQGLGLVHLQLAAAGQKILQRTQSAPRFLFHTSHCTLLLLVRHCIAAPAHRPALSVARIPEHLWRRPLAAAAPNGT